MNLAVAAIIISVASIALNVVSVILMRRCS